MADEQYNLPETPAHVFALRAFKQALFGTPKPSDDLDLRKHAANTSNESSYVRPKTSDGPARAIREDTLTLQSSPAKGILLTPGASASRRKTVSFGRDGTAQDEPLGRTPRQLPGKFPSPWMPKDGEKENAGPANRTKLTQSFTNSREENEHAGGKAERNVLQPRRRGKPDQDVNDVVHRNDKQSNGEPNKLTKDVAQKTVIDHSDDIDAPRAASGQYWKEQYETYSANSTAEVRALAKKARLAKKYAKHKDGEAVQLSFQLEEANRQIEQMQTLLKKAEQKGTSVEVLSKESQQLLGRMRDRALRAEKEVERLKNENKSMKRDLEKLQTTSASSNAAIVLKDASAPAIPVRSSRRPSLSLEGSPQLLQAPPTARTQSLTISTERPRYQQQQAPPASSDIWADVGIGSPSPAARPRSQLPSRTAPGKSETMPSTQASLNSKPPSQSKDNAKRSSNTNTQYSPPTLSNTPPSTWKADTLPSRRSSDYDQARNTNPTAENQPLRQRIANLNSVMDQTEARVTENENKLAAVLSRPSNVGVAAGSGAERDRSSRSVSGGTSGVGSNMTEERRDAAMKRLEARMAMRRNKLELTGAAVGA